MADDAKPLDAGTGRLAASFDPVSGAWLSVGAPHEGHGFIELSAIPPFDEARRGEPAATRRHRLEMIRGEHAFLVVEVDGAPARLVADLGEAPGHRWTGDGIEVRADPVPEAGVIGQAWQVRGPRDVRVVVRGRIDRPALAEITELDPPAPTGAVTYMSVEGATARLDAPVLPAWGTVEVEGAPVAWKQGRDMIEGRLAWPTGADVLRFRAAVALGPLADPGDGPPPGHPRATGDRLLDRALAYIRGCTALRTAADERVILTDHRALPLSWTRDAYWQALALLAADGTGDRERVADHLRWLWRNCDRPDGRWVRSHHADGRRKDLAFQADQQLYPLVELADYWRLTGGLPDGVDWSRQVARAWQATLEEVDPVTGFIGTAENAADDPVVAPFIAASQILLWYTASRVAEMASSAGLNIDVAALRSTADVVRASFATHVADANRPWPYAVDGAGARVAYHDANDLPLALTPLWGFCDPADVGWQASMAFAFSAANPGWCAGRLGGLGSAHTPGAWTLGDVQAWIHARTVGDASAAKAGLRRLELVAFADGMLPEAYDPDSVIRIRHWFAWPGAALAALRMLDRAGRLESRLAARPVR
ncbi:MAG: glycoside hydrolase family 125 protein [Candidatus Limnocylindria bacterium]